MSKQTDTITLRGMSFYAYHGCLESERVTGTRYSVDLECSIPLKKAGKSDNLKDTVDYSLLYNIVAAEMATPSNLLEHVAAKILKQVKYYAPKVKSATVIVTKFNPPFEYAQNALDAEGTSASVTMSY